MILVLICFFFILLCSNDCYVPDIQLGQQCSWAGQEEESCWLREWWMNSWHLSESCPLLLIPTLYLPPIKLRNIYVKSVLMDFIQPSLFLFISCNGTGLQVYKASLVLKRSVDQQKINQIQFWQLLKSFIKQKCQWLVVPTCSMWWFLCFM